MPELTVRDRVVYRGDGRSWKCMEVYKGMRGVILRVAGLMVTVRFPEPLGDLITRATCVEREIQQ